MAFADRPSTFDRLQSQPPPPPRRRQAPSPDHSAASPPPDIGAGNRLAHLLRPGHEPAADRRRAQEREKATTEPNEPEASTARLAALEADIATLTARLDSLHPTVTARLDDQQEKLLEAVAALLDERLGPRR